MVIFAAVVAAVLMLAAAVMAMGAAVAVGSSGELCGGGRQSGDVYIRGSGSAVLSGGCIGNGDVCSGSG